MTHDTIRVGLIDTGGWTRYGHIPALRSLDAFQIVAIASRTMETARGVAAEFAIPHAFDDERALIDRSDVDLVVVLTPALDHARLVRLVIERGKDVYSEWPLSTTTAESESLLRLRTREASGTSSGSSAGSVRVRATCGTCSREATSVRCARQA